MCVYIHIHTCVYIYIYITWLASNSVPTWSSRLCFTACHVYFGQSSGRDSIRIEPNWKRGQLELSPIGNEPCVLPSDFATGSPVSYPPPGDVVEKASAG